MPDQNNILVKLAHKIGMDKAIAYSSGARIIQAGAGVVLVLLIAIFLTAEEQGYYFTFNSVLSIQTFFELGFTTIITQFVAYEVSHLKLLKNNVIEGEDLYKSRLSSLLHFSIKWYAVASLLFLSIVLPIGYWFFRGGNDGVSWQIPWIMVSIATAIKMFQAPLTAILMGLDKVTEMNKVIFYQQFVHPIIVCVGLATNCKLYVLGISSCVSVSIWFLYVWRSNLVTLLKNVYNEQVDEKVDYLKEIFPYQWRIALSSLSGYFIFHLLTPILFKYQGSIIAGQVGLSISVISAIQALSMSWLNTKTPLYSRLIALKQYNELDVIFNKTMRQMVLICCSLMLFAFVALTMASALHIQYKESLLAERFLSGFPLLFLMVAYLTDMYTFSWATYLRCHKKEPYLAISVVTGLLCIAVIFISAKYSSVFFIMLGYAIARTIILPWGYNIYKNCKLLWHKE